MAWDEITTKRSFWYGLNQWEGALLRNASSHWLSPYPDWSLVISVSIWIAGEKSFEWQPGGYHVKPMLYTKHPIAAAAGSEPL